MGGTVTVEIDATPVACEEGRPLLEVILGTGLAIETACGGKGTCHLCRVNLAAESGPLPPASALETRALGNVLVAQGMRLACQVVARKGLRLTIPRRSSKAERRASRPRGRAKEGKA